MFALCRLNCWTNIWHTDKFEGQDHHLWTVPHMLYRIPGKHGKPRIPVLIRKTQKLRKTQNTCTENYRKHGKPRILICKMRNTQKTQNTCTENTENNYPKYVFFFVCFRSFPCFPQFSVVFRVFCAFFRVFCVFHIFRSFPYSCLGLRSTVQS